MTHTGPFWVENAVFYELYVRAFYDSNADGHGDLSGLMQKLDYLQELGVDCLWLLPIYHSPLTDDGYDIADYYGIHPDYGSLEDFKALLGSAHARSLRIIMDLVLNHTSDQHPWFQSARSDRNSPYRDYYVWSDTGQEYAGARIIFLDTEKSNWTWDSVAGQYYWHRFYSSQPDLNFDNPAVQAEMLKVVDFWLGLGVDGFRVDAVPYLFEREGTNCENLPETHACLKRLRSFVDEKYPGRLLLCEANQVPQDVRAYFGEGDEFQMAFQFPLMPRIFMALKQGQRAPIVQALEQTPPIPPGCAWANFLRNHDELTLEMVTPAERDWMWARYAPQTCMRQNLGIRRRLAPLLENDLRRIELAHSLIFSLPGVPFLYYGDEIGMGDDLRLPDRNGLRTPMQWEPLRQAGFSTAAATYLPVIQSPPWSPDCVNVASQRADPHSLWHAVRRMICLRKEQPAFTGQGLSLLNVGNEHIIAFERKAGAERVVVLANLSDQTQVVPAQRLLSLQLLESQVIYSGRLLPPGHLELEPFVFYWIKDRGVSAPQV